MLHLLDEDDENIETGSLKVTVEEGRGLLYGSIDEKIDRLLDLRTAARNATTLSDISSIIAQLAGEFSAHNSTT